MRPVYTLHNFPDSPESVRVVLCRYWERWKKKENKLHYKGEGEGVRKV
jgi:hypothetical protein